jgi:hypothetical protein
MPLFAPVTMATRFSSEGICSTVQLINFYSLTFLSQRQNITIGG